MSSESYISLPMPITTLLSHFLHPNAQKALIHYLFLTTKTVSHHLIINFLKIEQTITNNNKHFVIC